MTAWQQHRALDALAPDHLPACPKCGDLAAPNARYCRCGAPLYSGLKARRGERQRAFCQLCGALTTNVNTRLCRAHSDLAVDTVPSDPLESLPMSAAETLGEVEQAPKGMVSR